MSVKTKCPVCDCQLTMPENTLSGELLECPDCGSELEIVNLDPFQVEEAPAEDEDWGQ